MADKKNTIQAGNQMVEDKDTMRHIATQ